jgi:predicted amidohydrolase YtcJ
MIIIIIRNNIALMITGKVIGVGSGEAPDVDVDTDSIDMHGAFIMPGLQDAHLHVFHLGAVCYNNNIIRSQINSL